MGKADRPKQQKPLKKWYYSAAHWELGNAIYGGYIVRPITFYDFCCSLCVSQLTVVMMVSLTVNTSYTCLTAVFLIICYYNWLIVSIINHSSKLKIKIAHFAMLIRLETSSPLSSASFSRWVTFTLAMSFHLCHLHLFYCHYSITLLFKTQNLPVS